MVEDLFLSQGPDTVSLWPLRARPDACVAQNVPPVRVSSRASRSGTASPPTGAAETNMPADFPK
jgi:hypothetical protein